jgi:CobQ-like glutamine amidotransferase family enzyme
MSTRDSAVRLVVVLPELLGTYGDGGNATILERRLAWRGIAVERIDCPGGTPVPEHADLYLLGGGEDRPQTLAARELVAAGAVRRAVEQHGAALFAVCAGYQLLGESFPGADGPEPGLGLIDAVTRVGTGPRAVGELVVEPDPALGLPVVTGFENHQGVTALGPGARPLGRVTSGIGNGAGAGDEGAYAGKVVATYSHGPVLARNPALADHVLSLVVGDLPALDQPELATEIDALRAERLRASVRPARRSSLLRRVRRS